MKYADDLSKATINAIYVGKRFGTATQDQLQAEGEDGYSHLRSVDHFGTITQDALGVGPALAVESIKVTPPTKVTYTVGDEIDLTGMVVTGTLADDGNTIVISNDDLTISGFDSTTATEEQIVIVTYQGKTATFTVTITAAE